MIQQCLQSLLILAFPPPASARQGLSAQSTPSPATHQPHHQVGEDSDPQRGDDEGEHEELLPAGLAAVGDGDAQEEDEWPGELHNRNAEVLYPLLLLFTGSPGG